MVKWSSLAVKDWVACYSDEWQRYLRDDRLWFPVGVTSPFLPDPTAREPKTPGIKTCRLFELVQKTNLLLNCCSSGNFVLKSTSKHKPISYEIRLSYPTRVDIRSIPYIHSTNDTVKPPHREHAAPAAISRHERHEPTYKI